MTKREALQIVLDHAARNIAGTGCGIRAEIQQSESVRVVEAMAVLWPDAHGYDLAQNDLFNRGISILVPARGREVSKPDRRTGPNPNARRSIRRRADKTAIAIERGVFPRRK